MRKRQHARAFWAIVRGNAAVPAGCCIVPCPAEGKEKKGKGMKATKVGHSQRMQKEAGKDEEVEEQNELARKGRSREKGEGKRRKAQHEINLWQLLKVQHALHQ